MGSYNDNEGGRARKAYAEDHFQLWPKIMAESISDEIRENRPPVVNGIVVRTDGRRVVPPHVNTPDPGTGRRIWYEILGSLSSLASMAGWFAGCNGFSLANVSTFTKEYHTCTTHTPKDQ